MGYELQEYLRKTTPKEEMPEKPGLTCKAIRIFFQI